MTEHSPPKHFPAGSKRCGYCPKKNYKKKRQLYSVFHARSQCAQTITLGFTVLVLKM
jgi:hypothetical protein